jgi:acetate kinase
VLGGLDVFVFTAGIGEHSAKLRAAICEGPAWTGARLDPQPNEAAEPRIHAGASRVELPVIPTNDELPIARAVQRLVNVWRYCRIRRLAS